MLYAICEEDASIDVTVNIFSDFITGRANPFFQICVLFIKFFRKTEVA